MNRNTLVVSLATSSLAALVGCTDPEASGPPELVLGEDVCADCGMSIIESKFAAAVLVEVDGRREHAVFDDVGCLIYWQEHHADARILERWSRTKDRDGWVTMDAGHFVVGSTVQTPMDFRIVCCSTREEAEKVIAQSGGVLTPYPAVRPVPFRSAAGK